MKKMIFHLKEFKMSFVGICLFLMLSTSFSQDRVWTKKADMLIGRTSFGASVVLGKIYIIGGQSFDGNVFPRLSSVEMYDPITDTWLSKAQLPSPREALSTAVVNEKIYAIGGRFGSTFYNDMDEYDPVLDTWTPKSPMINGRAYFSA